MTTLSIYAAEWQPMPPLPHGNGNFIAGAINNDLILAGGISWSNDVKNWGRSIWRFDSPTGKWEVKGDLKQPVAYAVFAQTSEGIYFAGGSDGKVIHDKLQLLDARLELQTVSKLSIPLHCSGFTTINEDIWVVCGGTDVNDLKSLTNQFCSIHLKTGKTTVRAEYPGGKLLLPTAAAVGHNFYVFGGASFDPAQNSVANTNAAYLFSEPEGKWNPIKPYPMPVRGLASCALDERYILLGGGYTDAFTDVAYVYDTKTDFYLQTTPLPFRGMSNFVKVGDYIYWIGGEDKMRHRSNLSYRIQWRELLTDTLAMRDKHAIIQPSANQNTDPTIPAPVRVTP